MKAGLACLLVLIALSGCATAGPLAFSCPGFSTTADHGPYAVLLPKSQLEREIQGDSASPELFDPLENRLRNRMMLALVGQTPPSNGILLLSGGGQWGAFGAAFLAQLHRQGALPRFEAITGVSTGALQSLFVAAGQAGDDHAYDALVTAYSPTAEKQIVDRHPTVYAAIGGSVAGLKPLRRQVEAAICQDVLRPCLVDALKTLDIPVLLGFVGAHSGQFYYVDAVKVAQLAPSRQLARDCIAGAALASAGMPVFLQQIRVGGHTYYDGGVRESVFQARIAASAERARVAQDQDNRRHNLLAAATPAVPIYVIRNGPTQVNAIGPNDPDPDKKADALTAAERAEPIIVNQVEVGSIASLRLEDPSGTIKLVTADGWDTGGSSGARCVKPPKTMFDPTFMACLRRYGQEKASADPHSRWIDLSPIGARIAQSVPTP